MSIKKQVALGLFSMASVFTLSQVAANADTKVTVKAGDTLYKIATKYHTTVNTLAKANHLKDANTIVAGSQITIPGKSTAATKTTSTSSNSGAKKYTTGKTYTGKKKQTTSTYVSPSSNKQTSTSKSLSKTTASTSTTKSTKNVKQSTSLKANTTTNATNTGTATATESDTTSGVTTLAQKLSTQSIPYQWGGTTTKGFDCSGFVQYVYKQNGVTLPRTAEAQAEATTNKSVSNAQPGDLLFWGSKGGVYHDAIYLGNNQYANAPQPGQTVQVQTISPYFAPSFAGSVNA
ncbi:C40 family peptidase [Lentilactobacillus farraginis]|uniref:NLP/P60 family protein n=2 Tax=Lentilactobacillus farraginis DSM 18382 = JCM 14108 TaxID=1423743 RepID=X0PCI1_9LACO|nr:C40 family peptidase [Lentilactobacillus farraginis]GAF38113.1 NLP/P60 family protein [Lentilactobacillus farraginis DSM 18382 = JCM 14108]